MAGRAEFLLSWAAEHAFFLSLVCSLLFVPVWLLVMLGPKLLVDCIQEGSLPDAETGFRRSDALPVMPPAYLRYLAFLYSANAIRLVVPRRRWLIRLVRWLTVVLYVGLFVGFVVSATEGLVFDPDADILKSDLQRYTSVPSLNEPAR